MCGQRAPPRDIIPTPYSPGWSSPTTKALPAGWSLAIESSRPRRRKCVFQNHLPTCPLPLRPSGNLPCRLLFVSCSPSSLFFRPPFLFILVGRSAQRLRFIRRVTTQLPVVFLSSGSQVVPNECCHSFPVPFALSFDALASELRSLYHFDPGQRRVQRTFLFHRPTFNCHQRNNLFCCPFHHPLRDNVRQTFDGRLLIVSLGLVPCAPSTRKHHRYIIF